MAHILGIDLDAAEIRLAELQPAGGGFALHAALALPAGPADANTLGMQLKERLKEVGFKATTAVISLGHDALMCREVRHPEIPPEELPAIVQFQVLKEATLSIDDSVVDYIPLKHPLPTGERRSLTYVVRKGRLAFCEKLCEAAGLKLMAVVPRGVALLAGAAGVRNESNQQALGLACSNTFLVIHQNELIFNRSLGTPENAPELLAELRRSIAGYENQANMPKLASLHVASHELPAGFDQMAGQLRVPVAWYDPYASVQGAQRLAGHGDYAVACGAASALKTFRTLPVDFLAPKRVMPKPNRKKSYAIIGGIATVAALLLVWGFYWLMTSSSDTEIAGLKKRISVLQEQEKAYGDVDKRAEAIMAWVNLEIVVLDELYDLFAAFPDTGGLQITRAEWKPLTTTIAGNPSGQNSPFKTGTKPNGSAAPKIGPQTKPIATLSIEATSEQPDEMFPKLIQELGNGRHWKLEKKTIVPQDKNRMHIELSIQPVKPSEYASLVSMGKYATSTEAQPTQGTRRRPRFQPPGGARP